MTILQTGLANQGAVVPAGYQIERSLRFNSADSAHLSWTPPQAGNRKTWTWSGWVKRSALVSGGAYNNSAIFTAGTSNPGFILAFDKDSRNDAIQVNVTRGTNSGCLTNAVFRDLSAWYHIVLAFDTTQATAANRVKLWVNGVEQTWFQTNYPSQNTDYEVNNTSVHNIGRASQSSSEYSNHYITEVNFIDGQALTPSDFGETSSSTGVWIPKAYTGSYGQNGFYLPFNDNSTVLNLGRNRQTLTADPYFPLTTLLLNGNGTNGAQNNTFLDSGTANSGSGFTITRNGNTTQGTFSPFSQTGWSNFFNGSTDYLTVADNAAFTLGTGDFTVEYWAFVPSAADTRSFGQMDASATLSTISIFGGINSSGKAYSGARSGSTEYACTSTGNFPTGQWVHHALVRDGSTLRQYINGVQDGTSAISTASINDSSAVFAIGRLGAYNAYYWNGYISNFRLVKGTCLYPSGTTFTPPAAALTAITNTSLLTCQSNRFVDNSSNAFAITVNGTPSVQAFSPFAPTAAYSAATNGGSGYFDGTGDELSAGSNAAFAFGTGAYTVEFWTYLTAAISSTHQPAFITNDTTGGFVIYNDVAGTKLQIGARAAGSVLGTNTDLLPNRWNHVVAVRSGTGANQTSIYINGSRVANGTDATNWSVTGPCKIGGFTTSNYYVNGYISGMRVVKGTAVYDPTLTTLTVPTAPPTAITNTSLLLNFTNAGIIDSTGDQVVETVGNVSISNVSFRWGGTSIRFNGAGTDYLALATNINTLLHQIGDWQYDVWVNYVAVPTTGFQNVFGQGTAGQNSYGLTVSGAPSKFVVNQANIGNRIVGTTTVTTGVWYHVTVARANGVIRLYVNGVQEGSSYSDSGNYAFGNSPFTIGANANCYIADFRFTRFARVTGNFSVPIAQYSFNTADINVKQWVPNNFSVTAGTGNDSLVDSPTNYGTDTGVGGEVRGNYATLNPLKNGGSALSNGNLDQVSAVNNAMVLATIGMQSGKWYWEVSGGTVYGIAQDNVTLGNYIGQNANSWGYHQAGTTFTNAVSTAYGNTWTGTDVIGIAFDADNGRLFFSKNGVWQNSGSPTAGTNPAYSSLTNGPYFPAVQANSGATAVSNFGQRPFAYTAPSGFKALNTQNLPTPAIGASSTTLASQQMNIALWTGNGAASRAITGLGFSPDLVWYKSRSNAYSSRLFDSVRGANKELITNLTDAEATVTTELLSFDSDGFTIGSETATNGSGATFVGWAWRGSDSSAVSNTAGSITSTVSANQTAGISVVTYTGNGTLATIGHGLGAAPRMIIVKNRGNGTIAWVVYHVSTGKDAYLQLNATNASTSTANYWGSANPTSTVFGADAYGGVNSSANTYVAYCFAEVAGFSRFGSYTGNGSTDGPFVYCGFRPRWVLIKSSSDGTASNDWAIIDAARNTFNESAKFLRPNLSAAEGDDAGTSPAISIDILSNGFKVRGTSARINTSSSTYIFAAFGESPFNYSRAR